MSFVRDILIDPSSSAIAQAIISLARTLDLEVIAEGVESEAQRDYLARLGRDFWQGFLIGRPVPAAQFEEIAAKLMVRPYCQQTEQRRGSGLPRLEAQCGDLAQIHG